MNMGFPDSGPKTPQRMCVICRTRLPKDRLDRFVIRPGDDGPIKDARQTMPGRGFYLCHDQACVARSEKHKLFRRKPKGVSA